MSDQVMDRIRGANPIPEALPAPPIEEVWRRIDTTGDQPRRSVGGRNRRLALPSISGLVIALSLAVVVAVGFAGVVLLVHHRKGPGPRPITTPATRPTGTRGHRGPEQRVRTLTAGIPQSGTVLGNPHAAVTVTVFADLECPICRAFFAGRDFRRLVAREVRRGAVKVNYRSLCTTTCDGSHPTVFSTQQLAAYAAGQQRRFWEYALLFYVEQGHEGTPYVTAKYLNRLARQTPGLRITRWRAERRAAALRARLQRDGAIAAGDQVDATPTLIISGPKGTRRVLGLTPYSQIQDAIRRTA